MLFNQRFGENQVLRLDSMALDEPYRIYFELSSTVSTSDMDVDG